MDPSFKICVGSAHAISFYALLDLQKKGKIDQKWVHWEIEGAITLKKTKGVHNVERGEILICLGGAA